jgi:hypothetical protein
MNPTFISFYIDFDKDKKYYENSYYNLKNQFDILTLKEKYYFKNLENINQSTYDKNCLLKPNFIIETQNELNVPIVWIDIDSKLNTQDLTFFHNLEEYDAAFVMRNSTVPESFLMYFNNTKKAKDILNFYKEKCLDGEVNLDHYAIIELWKNIDQFNAKIKTFDSSYGSTNPSSKIILGVSSFYEKRSIERKVYDYRKANNKLCH